MRAYLLNK